MILRLSKPQAAALQTALEYYLENTPIRTTPTLPRYWRCWKHERALDG